VAIGTVIVNVEVTIVKCILAIFCDDEDFACQVNTGGTLFLTNSSLYQQGFSIIVKLVCCRA
jgi:hypothetical protein